ncbi:MAG TPA: hypothetical protein VGU70_05590 [Methylobacterium sp.]|jgi:hypothetical protein|uniref:hypothetical protein n=1 Tax=Methylorubrum sp. B1-46 TaxID=2897334 RepID=UPI001E624E6B|nr:hypothetical protein [Methylorubrum sp. B1-46]UGB24802.1 hypothetical protein LPC10_17905 [Methylorubrum sp. B1-46]HEV2542218.1 hypothetical protein [Methylobacterium sp.]
MIPDLRPIARAALCATAALLAVQPAAARGPGFDFPAEVAGFTRGPRTDYEARAPGLGYSVVYTNGRWKADIYVYDAGVANIPDGAPSPAVAGQLAQAADDVKAAVAQGIYRDSKDRGPVRLPGEASARLTCRTFTIDHPALGPTESLLCLTGLRGQFVKFRLSGPAAKRPPKEEAERFITGWLDRQ